MATVRVAISSVAVRAVMATVRVAIVLAQPTTIQMQSTVSRREKNIRKST